MEKAYFFPFKARFWIRILTCKEYRRWVTENQDASLICGSFSYPLRTVIELAPLPVSLLFHFRHKNLEWGLDMGTLTGQASQIPFLNQLQSLELLTLQFCTQDSEQAYQQKHLLPNFPSFKRITVTFCWSWQRPWWSLSYLFYLMRGFSKFALNAH